eukprot:CAMPEP_0114529638 /NCGR_PEP_ID=MMETSP0109-20121206/24969_1 /TAXON_ID=29199 /ORGANISM="Chlorarachnion reptans, Strain CCCM449" /LENGTH=327 /DNA_ID=CAMNT_0001712109 /DNA_START=254 /DNA_END=1233 /DNA_ORIENTATION=+
MIDGIGFSTFRILLARGICCTPPCQTFDLPPHLLCVSVDIRFRTVAVDVQESALWLQRPNSDDVALLRAWQQPQINPVGDVVDGQVLVVERVDGATILRDVVARKGLVQSLDRRRVYLTRMHVRGPPSHQIGQREVSDARVQVDHDVPGIADLAHALLLASVPSREHRPGDVEPVDHAALLVGHPAALVALGDRPPAVVHDDDPRHPHPPPGDAPLYRYPGHRAPARVQRPPECGPEGRPQAQQRRCIRRSRGDQLPVLRLRLRRRTLSARACPRSRGGGVRLREPSAAGEENGVSDPVPLFGQCPQDALDEFAIAAAIRDPGRLPP